MLIDIATASPPYKVSQHLAASELKKRMTGSNAAGRLIEMTATHSGIDERYIVIPDAETTSKEKFYSNNGNQIIPGTKQRMDEYEKWSKLLSCDAVGQLMKQTGFSPEELDKIITVSCTGFFAPGLDYFLINEFGFSSTIKRTNIGFMGCAASIIGFSSALEALNSKQDINILLVSVEICSLHIQMEPTRDNILANMVFADGCGAALLSNTDKYSKKVKLNLMHTDSILFGNSSQYMGWKIGNTGFEMLLSSELPKIILNDASPALVKILNNHNIDYREIKHWALHPGGRAILDSLQNGLNLNDEQMRASRTVLRKFGNLSSASILFVINELLESGNIKKDELCCAVAFGPGLTMETAVFKGA